MPGGNQQMHLVLLIVWLGVSLGLSETLTCLRVETSIASGSSSSSNDNPYTNPQILKQETAPAGDVCATYLARCASSSTLCTPQEVEAANWKWVYGILSGTGCEALKADYSNYKYVTCCTTDNCNVPDPELDPDSHLDPTVHLPGHPVVATTPAVVDPEMPHDGADLLFNSSSTRRDAKAGNATLDRAKGSAKLAANAANGAFRKVPVRQPATAKVLVVNRISTAKIPADAGATQAANKLQQHPLSSFKAGESVAGNLQFQQQLAPLVNRGKQHNLQAKHQQLAQDTNNKNSRQQWQHVRPQAQQAQQHNRQQQPGGSIARPLQQQHRPKHMAYRSASQSISCFRNILTNRNMAPAVAAKAFHRRDGVDVCARYKFQCSNSDNMCTAGEVRNKRWKWAYLPLDSATCMGLRSYSNSKDAIVKHVQCCTSNNCNRPNPDLDSKTTVITQGVAANTLQPAKSGTGSRTAQHNSPSQRPANKRKEAAALAVAVPTAEQHQPVGTLRPNRLACYTSMPRVAAQAPSVAPKVYHKSSDGVNLCARYQIKCSIDKKMVCTTTEADSGAWIWEYKPLSAPICNEMKAIAAVGAESGYMNVLCCSGNVCNKPDASLDPLTKVVRAESASVTAHTG